MKIISQKKAEDSPVYTFIKNLKPPILAVAEAVASGAATLPMALPVPAQGGVETTLSILMEQAEKALQGNNFIVAKALFADLHQRMPNDVSVVHKLALATYKAKIPSEMDALREALQLLEALNPAESTDTETLGLLQAVHKRLWKLTEDRSSLDSAVWSSEKGFYLKNDYYNGINLAYLYNVRALISEGLEAITDFVLAKRTRRKVVEICQPLLDQIRTGGNANLLASSTPYWVLATLAEAWTGLGDEGGEVKSENYLKEALALDPPPAKWMIESTQEQLKNLRGLLADSLRKSELNSAQVSGAKCGPTSA
jgi:hypothetical protein